MQPRTKHMIFIIIIFLLMALGLDQLRAQSVNVDLKDLPPNVAQAIIESQKEPTAVATVSGWSGMGKEIGEAISTGLMAVVAASDKFGKSEVGYFTMAMIGFSILGKPIMAFILEIVISILIVSIAKKLLLKRKVVVSSEGWFKKKQYEYLNPIFSNERDSSAGLFVFIAAAFWAGLTLIIMLNGFK